MVTARVTHRCRVTRRRNVTELQARDRPRHVTRRQNVTPRSHDDASGWSTNDGSGVTDQVEFVRRNPNRLKPRDGGSHEPPTASRPGREYLLDRGREAFPHDEV